jgi:hypothetical protein
MNVDPRQNDPQYQRPLSGDSEQASQFGMGSQADMPLQQGAQGSVPGMRAVDPNSVTPGAEVYGTDGKRLGTVKEVYDDSFLVQKGIFFVHDYFVPWNVVTRVAVDRIDLSLTADYAKNQDWSRRPGPSAPGRGAQADSATDSQRGGLNTQNNVTPSGLGTNTMGGDAAGATPNQGAGGVMPNQAPNQPMGKPMDAGLSPSGDAPTQYGAGQYDQGMNPDPGTTGGSMNAGGMAPENRPANQGMQGSRDPDAGNRSGDPQVPRNPDDSDFTQQGMTNP